MVLLAPDGMFAEKHVSNYLLNLNLFNKGCCTLNPIRTGESGLQPPPALHVFFYLTQKYNRTTHLRGGGWSQEGKNQFSDIIS